jgi:hypothetical protein
MRLAWHAVHMGDNRNAYRVLMGKPKGKRPLGKRRRRWEYNITMDIREMGWGGMGVKLTSHFHLVPRSRIVELYLHSPIRLYGVVLN